MTIDEVIAKYKEITSTDSICPGHCNISCDKCMQESKQIIEWLEELVMLRLDSCMIHMPERLRLVENGYNKALDDCIKEVEEEEKQHNHTITKDCLFWLKRKFEQLKEGDNNER